MPKKIDYHKRVNYGIADPAKILAQQEAAATAKHLPFGFKEAPGSRGESAYVFDMGQMYGALVIEGLGTKSLVADAVYKATGQSYFANIAHDTVAAIINDLISVGARPVALNAYWSADSYDWLANTSLVADFIKGWREACDVSGVTWGGGETQALSGIVEKDALELAGSAFGVIKPKSQLVSSTKLADGDAIVMIASGGVHANGISLIRELAKDLEKGYETALSDGRTLGQAVLEPTIIYARFVRSLLEADLDIHYLSNITGHGWRKIMRADRDFTYVINKIPEPGPLFDFIQAQAGNSDQEMYGTFNMGAGYAVYLPNNQCQKVLDIAGQNGLDAWVAGDVTKGPRRVIIKPLKITFEEEALKLR